MKRFIAFGHSHIVAVANAFYERGPNPRMPEFVYLHGAGIVPNLSENGLHPAIREKIVSADPEFILLAAGGNEHNLIGLSGDKGAFDFVLPESPELPLDRSGEIIPAALVYATMERRMAEPLALLRYMGKHADVPVLQIEPPPPIPDEEWIGHVLAGQVSLDAIRPRWVRHKLWRLQSLLYRTTCAESGVTFIPSPSEAIDSVGMLVREAWGGDATHANSWYGRLVLDLVERATS